MDIVDRWLLPDGVEDVLPPEAKTVENVRRNLLDHFESWGYEYVIPPMVEYLESLLTGTGRDLDLKTFKVVDQLTGRMMGVRADITPQVARIDAHSLGRDGIARLCYAGTVVQTQADSMLASRTPLSVGAELFGDPSTRGDVEIVSMMVQSLKSAGLGRVHVDLGNVDIFRQLVASLNLTDYQQESLFEAVQKKAVAEIRELCGVFELDAAASDLLAELPALCGDRAMLDRAREKFSSFKGIIACIENLAQISDALSARFTDVGVYFDLSELRGYAYHTGIVFAAYANSMQDVIAKGGRYDSVGQVFGRSGRSATGFSIDVRTIARQVQGEATSKQKVYVTPADIDQTERTRLWVEVDRLRAEGYIVVESGNGDADGLLLVENESGWQLVPAKEAPDRG